MPALVGVPRPHEDVRGLLGVVEHPRPGAPDLGDVVGMDVPPQEVPDQFRRDVSGQAFVGRADVLASGFEVEDDDAVRRMLHERAESCFCRRDARLRLAPLGDVVHVDDDALDDGIVELIPRRNLAPAQRAVAMVHAHVGAQ